MRYLSFSLALCAGVSQHLSTVSHVSICFSLASIHVNITHAEHASAVSTGTAHGVSASSPRAPLLRGSERKNGLAGCGLLRALFCSCASTRVGRPLSASCFESSCHVLRLAPFALRVQCLLSSPRAVSINMLTSVRPNAPFSVSIVIHTFAPSSMVNTVCSDVIVSLSTLDSFIAFIKACDVAAVCSFSILHHEVSTHDETARCCQPWFERGI